jgi:CHAT domain-containing protein
MMRAALLNYATRLAHSACPRDGVVDGRKCHDRSQCSRKCETDAVAGACSWRVLNAERCAAPVSALLPMLEVEVPATFGLSPYSSPCRPRVACGMESKMSQCCSSAARILWAAIVPTILALLAGTAAASINRTAVDERSAAPDSATSPQALSASTTSLEAASRTLCADMKGGEPIPTDEIIDRLRDAYRDVSAAQDLMSWGDFDLTSRLLCRALVVRESVLGIAHPDTIAIFNNFGVLLRKQGRSADSRELLEHILEVTSTFPPGDRRGVQSILHNLATAMYAQGYMVEAEAIYRRLLEEEAASGSVIAQRNRGVALTNLAFSLEAQGKLSEAETAHREALKLRTSGQVNQELDASASLSNLGSNLTAQGRIVEAEPMLRTSLTIREQLLGPNNLNVGFSLATLADNLSHQGKMDEATALAERLIDLRVKAVGELHPETAAAFQLAATIALGAGQHERALELARSALAARVPETLREEAALSDNARMVLRRAPGTAALTLARAAWLEAGGRSASWGATPPPLVAEAFVATQQIPVTSTAEALSRAAARRAADGRGLGELAHQLESKLSAQIGLDRLLAEAAARRSDLSKLHAHRARLAAETSAVEGQLRRSYPDFFDYVRPEPLSLQTLSGDASVLRQDEVLLLLTPGAGSQKGLVFAVTQGGGAWAEISLDSSELQARIRRFRLLLDLAAARRPDVHTASPEASDFDWALATELYAALFSSPDVAKLILGKRRWILAPQGTLLSVPYAALVQTLPSGELGGLSALRSAAWLGATKVLSIIPSVVSLQSLRSTATAGLRPSHPFFGVGDPLLAGSIDGRQNETPTYYHQRLANVDAVRQLPRLPGTAQEITQMARALGANRRDYLLGAEATESEIKRRDRRGELLTVSVITFATHGLLAGDPRNSAAEPALVLTPPATPTDEDDGLLTASEAAQLRINADWVVLSACNTAAGDRISGEGLSGLARAFIAAGGRSLLASHWRVPDDVAGRITTRSVAIFRTQPAMTRAEAFVYAVREVIADSSRDGTSAPLAHPGLWAAFAYIGAD